VTKQRRRREGKSFAIHDNAVRVLGSSTSSQVIKITWRFNDSNTREEVGET
jgi:hypothetical protein